MINRTALRKKMKLWQSVSDKDLKRFIFATLFSEDIDNGNKVLSSIQKESKVGKNFKRLMSPSSLKQLSDGGLIYNRLAPIEVLLNVIQNMLMSESSEINKYIVLSKKYEKNLFSNNYEECKKVLEEIEDTVGFSVWGCSQHLLVEELSSGLEANKKLLGKYRKEMGNNLIVNTLLDFYSCSSEKNTGYLNYKDKIDKYFGSLGDSVVVSYLKFKLDYNVVCTTDIISIVLQIDSQLSIIDLYNSFIEILQCNSYSNYFNGEEVAVNISQYISDYRLTNLLILYGKYDC